LRIVGVLGAVLLGALAAHGDFDARQWRYYKEISGVGAAGFYAVDLAPDVMARAQYQLADLRIISGEATEQPYEVRIDRGERTVAAVAAKVYHLSRVPAKGTRFELDLQTREKFIREITINTPDHDFRYQVAVEGSHDARNWAMLRDDGAIFDFSGDVRSRSTIVKLPETNFRYLRVTIRDTGEKPIEVTGAQVNKLLFRAARRVQISPVKERIELNAERNANEVYLDLGRAGQPFDEVEVAFSDDNVRRPCYVRISNAPEEAGWRTVASDVVFRYHTATFVGEHATMAIPETRSRYVRVSVLNFDDEPLNVTGVTLYGKPRTVVFEYKPETRVRLYYGSESVRSPRYDLSTFLRYEQLQPKTGLKLGAETNNEAYVGPRPPWTEVNSWLLWVVIAAAILVVGGMIVRLMAAVGAEHEPPDGAGE